MLVNSLKVWKVYSKIYS